MDFSHPRTCLPCLQMREVLNPTTNLPLLLLKFCNHLICLIPLPLITLFNSLVVPKLQTSHGLWRGRIRDKITFYSSLHISHTPRPPYHDSQLIFDWERGRKITPVNFLPSPQVSWLPTLSIFLCLSFKYYLLTNLLNLRVMVSFHLVRVPLLISFISPELRARCSIAPHFPVLKSHHLLLLPPESPQHYF